MPSMGTSAEIGRPAADVFAYATDPTRSSERRKGVVDVHIDPPKTWGVRGIDGPIRAGVEVLVEPVTDSRSQLTISVDFTGHGIGKILVPLMVRREARKEMPDNMAALKQRMEAG